MVGNQYEPVWVWKYVVLPFGGEADEGPFVHEVGDRVFRRGTKRQGIILKFCEKKMLIKFEDGTREWRLQTTFYSERNPEYIQVDIADDQEDFKKGDNVAHIYSDREGKVIFSERG